MRHALGGILLAFADLIDAASSALSTVTRVTAFKVAGDPPAPDVEEQDDDEFGAMGATPPVVIGDASLRMIHHPKPPPLAPAPDPPLAGSLRARRGPIHVGGRER